jgi:glycosyltransferase involved in cell wall biosynthesis
VSQTRTKKINILEVVGNAIVGGVERYVLHLTQRLPAHGFRVFCAAPYESPVTASLRELGAKVYTTRMDDEPTWGSIQFLTELIRDEKIQLIHAHLPRAQMLAGIAGCLAGVPVVMTFHGMEINTWELGIARTTRAYQNVVCQAAYYQALSLGVSSHRVRLIPNGVDTVLFHTDLDRQRFRQAFSIPASAPLVGFAGRLAKEKGPDMFVKLAGHVLKSRPDAYFVLVGDGPLRQEIAEMIRADNLDERVILAGVWDQMSEVYPALDVLVQTSRVEGMPLTLLEGMACGLPVAAMNVGGVSEIVEVGTTGYLSAEGDWAGLGDAVLKLLQDPDLMARMGEASRRRVVDRFDINRTVSLVAEGFRTILDLDPLAARSKPAKVRAAQGENQNGGKI